VGVGDVWGSLAGVGGAWGMWVGPYSALGSIEGVGDEWVSSAGWRPSERTVYEGAQEGRWEERGDGKEGWAGGSLVRGCYCEDDVQYRRFLFRSKRGLKGRLTHERDLLTSTVRQSIPLLHPTGKTILEWCSGAPIVFRRTFSMFSARGVVSCVRGWVGLG
jgi:hypothetical protein